MNQQCKVCGEPAAGFHFGAFTCEGCKSFFGRSYNNLNSITECKNNGECIINKKNRTACKSCRLRKCLLVGMSKSGSRYGRRSNWFKIHCLLQEQQQAAVAQLRGKNSSSSPPEGPVPLLSPLGFPPSLGGFLRPENASSPSVSSPDSDCSETGLYSPRANGSGPFGNKDFYLPIPFHSMFMQPPSIPSPFLLPPSLFPFPVTKHEPQRLSPEQVQSKIGLANDLEENNSRPSSRHSPTNNNDYSSKNKNNNNNNNNNIEEDKMTVRSRRFHLDAILGLRNTTSRSPTCEVENSVRSPKFEEVQDNPIDLSVRKSDCDQEKSKETENVEIKTEPKTLEQAKPIPLDLSV